MILYRKAIPFKSTPTTSGAWDGPANEANLDNDDGADVYRQAYAWVDPDKDPDTKAAYKFIHHEVSSDGKVGAANLKACSSAVGVLNGGRGGTTIPEADRQGVYDHLCGHLKDAGMDCPELKSLGAYTAGPNRRRLATRLRRAARELEGRGKRALARRLVAIARATDGDGGDWDEDAGRLAQALDATLDEALEAFQGGETDQGVALVVGAASTVDALLEAMGLADADEEGSSANARPQPGRELRRQAFRLTRVEVRSGSGGAQTLVGHAAVFNQLSDELGWLMPYRERILPGAFDDVLGDDVRALWNHNPDYVLGRTGPGTLKLSTDDTGLAIEIHPPDTVWAGDLMKTIDRGDVDQMSFAFYPGVERWTEDDETGEAIREHFRIAELLDVSPVTYPAYPQTDISARSALSDLGFDVRSLGGALLRRQRGLRLNRADQDAVRTAIEALTDLLSVPGQRAVRAAGARSAAVELDRLRRELDLRERAV